MTPNPARQFNIDAGLLSSVVLLGAVRTSSAGDEEPPGVIELSGIVRDFKERTAPGGHPDFERMPSHGFGLYCGNVDVFLGDDGRPVFTGNGRKITAQARDAGGEPIAPHLQNARFEAAGSAPESCTILEDSEGVDAFEVCLRDAVFNGDGTSTWTYRVRELDTGKDLSHWNLRLEPGQSVLEGTTPGYDHGVDGSTGFYGIKWDVDDGFSEGEFTIVLDGHYAGGEHDEGVLAKGGDEADRGGLFVPTGSISETGSPFPTGDALTEDPSLGDEAATTGDSSTGGIESADSFDLWFRDRLGVNLSRPLDLTLVRQDDGTYVFDDFEDPDYSDRSGFFPVDGQLFGDSGGMPDHNFHFSYEARARLTYDADADQFLTMSADDDLWVFIDGKLAIDLGGVHDTMTQTVDLDRLGLVDGETYDVDVFLVERHRTGSTLRIETNVELEPTGESLRPMMTMAFD